MSLLVKIYTPQELNHSSYIHTGLFELEKEGFLRTRIIFSVKKRPGTLHLKNNVLETRKATHPKTSFYELIDTKINHKITFATDLYDASYSFSEYALKHCDFVFKRNFETQHVSLLPEEYQKKILPLGWTFGVHLSKKNINFKFYWGLILSNLTIDLKPDRYFFNRLYNSLSKQQRHWSFIKTSRNINQFENNFSNFNSDLIIFQTRCFTNENNLELQELHQQRYHIIQLLQSHFPEQFRGGFISSEIAEKYYPDAITNLKTDPISYLELVKSSKIGIYTQGIQNSPAWKMAEYLSQGKVVIAQRFQTELAVPLEDQKHVLFFDDIKEIPELCDLIFKNQKLAEQLMENGRRYYENNIAPKQNIKRIIELMLNY